MSVVALGKLRLWERGTVVTGAARSTLRVVTSEASEPQQLTFAPALMLPAPSLLHAGGFAGWATLNCSIMAATGAFDGKGKKVRLTFHVLAFLLVTSATLLSLSQQGDLSPQARKPEFLEDHVMLGGSGVQRSVCLVTQDLAGPMMNGGIGTAFRNLAATLARRGHNVTVLYVLGAVVHPKSEKTFTEWQQVFQSTYRVNLVAIPDRQSFTYDATRAVRRSYEVFLWLQQHEHDFSIVHFHEWQGTGFFTLLAKQQQLLFRNMLFVVQAHSPSTWALEGNEEFPNELEFLDVDFMERKSVQFADVLLSPSSYLLSWFLEHGWLLPAASFVQPNVMLSAFDTSPYASRCTEKRREFVFFGRLEPRKGVFLFLEAASLLLNQLADSEAAIDVTFTLIGKQQPKYDSAIKLMCLNISTHFGLEIQVLSTLTPEGSAAYLRSDPCRVAVMPSKFENLPFVVMECIANKVPFLSSNAGGAAELLHPDFVDAATFTPDSATTLANRLAHIIRNGAPSGRFAPRYDAVVDVWDAWHSQVKVGAVARQAPTQPRARRPLVSVIMTTYNREYSVLKQALDSLAAQDFPAHRFEVILVDDGSTSPTAQQFSTLFNERRWKLLSVSNRYLGAARNAGVLASQGVWLMFMDDDNVARPDEISTFANVFALGRADILTCLIDEFSTPFPPQSANTSTFRWIHVANTQASWMHNTLGDANLFTSRAVFDSLGGFFTHRLAFEDWEFLNRALLSGYRIEVVPLVLFWKRKSSTSMLYTQDLHASTVVALQPFIKDLPGNIGTGLLLAKAALKTAQENGATAPLWDSAIGFRLVQGHRIFLCTRVRGGTSTEWLPLPLIGVTNDEDAIWSDNTRHFGPLAFGRFLLHPSIVEGEHLDAAKVWRSNTAGGVVFSGEVVKAGPGGDGVLFELYIGGVLKLSAEITDNRTQFDFSHSDFVEIGMEVAFSIHARGTDHYDAIWSRFVIVTAAVEVQLPQRRAQPPPAVCDTIVSSMGTVCAPKLFLVGAMKCGTNTLVKAMLQHPSIVPPLTSDATEYFHPHRRQQMTAEQYQRMFAVTDWRFNVTFDKSPSYFMSFGAAARIKVAVPRAKIVIAVCDPIERLWSHYWHVRSVPNELHVLTEFKAPFPAFVQSLLKVDNHGVLRIGKYAEHIAMWRTLFGNENVVTWNRDEYDLHTPETMLALFESLGMSPVRVTTALREFTKQHEDIATMDAATREALESFYGMHSQRP